MRKLARWAVGTFATATVLMTVAHLPPVNGWIGWTHHTGSGTCPFGYGKQETTARRASKPHDGAAAHARPALGFSLGETTRADLIAWAGAHGVWCMPSRGATELACSSAPLAASVASVPIDTQRPAGALPARSLWFDLDGDVLDGIHTVRRASASAPVASAFTAMTGTLTAEAGAPARTSGSPADLDKGAFQQAVAEYRFRDYAATLRATNMGDGFVLTESYAAL